MTRYIVLTHDLDKPDHWWADGPFDSNGDAHRHKARLGTVALEHRVIALVTPWERGRYEGWDPTYGVSPEETAVADRIVQELQP